MLILPPKKTSWIVLALFYTFDAFSSYWAIRYMGANEGNPVIAPYVEANPLLFFPIMVFGFILSYFIYLILKTVIWSMMKRLKSIKEEQIERIVLGVIIIFYFFTVIMNNSLYLLGVKAGWMLTAFLTTGIVTSLAYGISALYLASRKKSTKY
ncbi:MAG: DUF5658 family protein [Microgenomates group bacterium]